LIEIKLWFLTGINVVVIAMLVFFVVRWIKGNDKMLDSIEEANKGITDLKLSIEQIKSWSCDKFVSTNEFNRTIKDVKEFVAELNSNNHSNVTTIIPNKPKINKGF